MQECASPLVMVRVAGFDSFSEVCNVLYIICVRALELFVIYEDLTSDIIAKLVLRLLQTNTNKAKKRLAVFQIDKQIAHMTPK